jgi:CelD/BcsL family acetyltransferase involved in cellulose biosynthesis
MQIKVFRDLSDLNSLAQEWNHLLTSSASAVPFLRHEYLTTWWQTLGGGEWKRAELYVVTARQDDGALAGIAPLFFTENRVGIPSLMLLGSAEISDYLDVIARVTDLPVFLEALLAHLAGPNAPAWQLLDWYNILDSSPTLPAMAEAARKRNWAMTQEALQHCPYIQLPGDWETYLANQVDKKQRHEIRRKMRRIEELNAHSDPHHPPVRWYIVQDEAGLETEIEAFLQLMTNNPDKALFLTGMMRTQMRTTILTAFKAGWLQLSFLVVNGEKAAGYLNFDDENHIWVYNSGLDFRFREYSPGWVLLGYLLQWANENKRAVFDFMRGDEEYKYKFGAMDRRVVRVKIQRGEASA